MRTVIFGGGGFVGLNIVEALLTAGRPVQLVDLTPPPPPALDALDGLPGKLEVAVADVTAADSIAAVVTSATDAVVYGAAITAGAARDASEPERIVEVNLLGLVRVLRAARAAGVRRVINLSSSGALGAAAFGPALLEEAEVAADPQNLYALTKFASERAATRLADLWHMDVRNVRLSGVFGRFERQTGVRDTPSPPFQVMRAARHGEPAILARPGERDWIYATDVAAAVLALIDTRDLHHDLYNISTGRTFSVLAFGQRLATRHPDFVCRLAEPGEAATIDLFSERDRGSLAIDRLTADTPYRPRFDLAGAVDDYDQWLQDHPGYAALDR